jgi:hypothetical protein
MTHEDEVRYKIAAVIAERRAERLKVATALLKRCREFLSVGDGLSTPEHRRFYRLTLDITEFLESSRTAYKDDYEARPRYAPQDQ